MNLFSKIKDKAQNVKTEDKDFKGGKFTLDSGVYPARVRVAYIDSYDSGAIYVALDLLLQVDGKERQYKEQVCISNKSGDLTYTDKNGVSQPLPGYALIDTLSKVAIDKSVSELETEIKKVKVFNFTSKQEEPMDKEVLMDLVNAELYIGILEEQHDHYKNAGEVQIKNRIAKVFTKDQKTLAEKEANIEADYINSWITLNEGKLIDKTTSRAGKSNINIAKKEETTTSLF